MNPTVPYQKSGSSQTGKQAARAVLVLSRMQIHNLRLQPSVNWMARNWMEEPSASARPRIVHSVVRVAVVEVAALVATSTAMAAPAAVVAAAAGAISADPVKEDQSGSDWFFSPVGTGFSVGDDFPRSQAKACIA